MNLFKPQVKSLIERKEFDKLQLLLAKNSKLANEGITIPYDIFCRTKAHPLHRICDGVFSHKITEEEALTFANIFLNHGAEIDGDKKHGGGTPLIAAASLHAENLGIFYIKKGADVNHVYKGDGASAIHWASFCGRDKLVEELIQANAIIDEPDAENNSTPLGWALHAIITKDKINLHNQVSCIKLLLIAGAEINKLGNESKVYLLKLSEDDAEIQNLLK
jgi:ankyrin repeat protein